MIMSRVCMTQHYRFKNQEFAVLKTWYFHRIISHFFHCASAGLLTIELLKFVNDLPKEEQCSCPKNVMFTYLM